MNEIDAMAMGASHRKQALATESRPILKSLLEAQGLPIAQA